MKIRFIRFYVLCLFFLNAAADEVSNTEKTKIWLDIEDTKTDIKIEDTIRGYKIIEKNVCIFTDKEIDKYQIYITDNNKGSNNFLLKANTTPIPYVVSWQYKHNKKDTIIQKNTKHTFQIDKNVGCKDKIEDKNKDKVYDYFAKLKIRFILNKKYMRSNTYDFDLKIRSKAL